MKSQTKTAVMLMILFVSTNLHGQLVGITKGTVKTKNYTLEELSEQLEVSKFEMFKSTHNDIFTNQDLASLTPTDVELEDEMIAFFDPKNTSCNCNPDFAKELRKNIFRPRSGEMPKKLGFIPEPIRKHVEFIKAKKISFIGSKIFAGVFRYSYGPKNARQHGSGTVKDCDIIKNFEIENYIDKDISNLAYTLDCSGYVNAALNADVSFGIASVSSSAKSASTNKGSLLLLLGVMYSPLYQAFSGNGNFSGQTKDVLGKRKEVLEEILKKLPNYANADDTAIELDFDYRIMLTSNKGDANYNGEGTISGKAGGGFTFGKADGSAAASGKVERQVNFSDFNCYILTANFTNQPDKLTVKSIKDQIALISAKLTIMQ